MTKLNTKGFSVVEAFLILAVLSILGFTGWFVYHSKQSADKVLSSTGNSSVTQTKKSVTKTPNSTSNYLVIKEWGVKFPEPTGDTLSYSFSSTTNTQVLLASKQLAAAYHGCETFGAGILRRGMASDAYDPSGITYQQAYDKDPSLFGRVGKYFYFVQHDQSVCASTVTTAASQAQNATNTTSMQAVTKIVAAN